MPLHCGIAGVDRGMWWLWVSGNSRAGSTRWLEAIEGSAGASESGVLVGVPGLVGVGSVYVEGRGVPGWESVGMGCFKSVWVGGPCVVDWVVGLCDGGVEPDGFGYVCVGEGGLDDLGVACDFSRAVLLRQVGDMQVEAGVCRRPHLAHSRGARGQGRGLACQSFVPRPLSCCMGVLGTGSTPSSASAITPPTASDATTLPLVYRELLLLFSWQLDGPPDCAAFTLIIRWQ